MILTIDEVEVPGRVALDTANEAHLNVFVLAVECLDQGFKTGRALLFQLMRQLDASHPRRCGRRRGNGLGRGQDASQQHENS